MKIHRTKAHGDSDAYADAYADADGDYDPGIPIDVQPKRNAKRRKLNQSDCR